MALWFPLMLGDVRIGTLSVQRVKGSLRPDAIGIYKAEVVAGEQCWRGQVRHRYGDGAWALVRTVIAAAESDLGPTPLSSDATAEGP